MATTPDTIFISKAVKILRSGPMAGRWSLRLNGEMPPVLDVRQGTSLVGSITTGKEGYDLSSPEGMPISHFKNLEEAIMFMDLQVLMSLMLGISPVLQPTLVV